MLSRLPLQSTLLSLAISCCLSVAKLAPAADAPRAIPLETRVISWESAHYHGWPTVARRRDGELLLVYSGGRESHVCPFGRVELMSSRDGGLTWNWPQVLHDGPIDDRDAGVVETAQGTLLVTTFTSLAYQPQLERATAAAAGSSPPWDPARLARWQAAHRRLPADRLQAELGTWMLRSTDGGATWSARYSVPVNSPHGPVVLRDGRLIYPGVSMWHGERKVGVCESTDDGLTWSWLAEIPTHPSHEATHYHELHAVEATDGTLVCHIRNENQADADQTLQSESNDGGRTWSVPHPIGAWGLPSHLLRLVDGRLLMSYGYRRRPFGNQARVSADQGRTWSEPLTLSSDGQGGDLGYPSTVQLDDGTLVTVWYEVLADSPRAQLRQLRWRLE